MSDNKKPLRPHGVVTPKGQSWLNEVRVDAARNTTELLLQQKRDREFEQAKAEGITVKEIIENSQNELVDEQVLENSAGEPGSVEGETPKDVKENEKAEEESQKDLEKQAEANSVANKSSVDQKGSK